MGLEHRGREVSAPAADVQDAPRDGEVVAGEGLVDDVERQPGHPPVEGGAVLGVVTHVAEERRTEGGLEGRLAGAHGVLELAPGGIRRAPAVQGEVAHRPGRPRAQQRAHLGRRHPVIVLERHQPDVGQAAHEPAQQLRLRLGRGAQLVDRHRPVSEQVGQAQARHRTGQLDRDVADEQVPQVLGRSCGPGHRRPRRNASRPVLAGPVVGAGGTQRARYGVAVIRR